MDKVFLIKKVLKFVSNRLTNRPTNLSLDALLPKHKNVCRDDFSVLRNFHDLAIDDLYWLDRSDLF